MYVLWAMLSRVGNTDSSGSLGIQGVGCTVKCTPPDTFPRVLGLGLHPQTLKRMEALSARGTNSSEYWLLHVPTVPPEAISMQPCL